LINFDTVYVKDTLTVPPHIAMRDSVADTVEKFSSFIGSNTSVISPEPVMRTTHEWLLFVLLALLGVVAVINFLSAGRVMEILGMAFSVDKWKKYFSEYSSSGQGIFLSALFFINFLITVSVLFYLFVRDFTPDIPIKYNSLEIIAYISVFLLLYIFILNTFIVIVNKILGQEAITRVHLKINNYLQYITGIFLLPLLVIYIYTSSGIWLEISLIIFLLFFGLKIVIFLLTGIKIFPVSGFHIFLYLCTLEILPLFIVIKFLSLNVL
jgi:hypothetical protein